VYNGLLAMADTDLVAIHDGARPLVSAQTVSATMEAADAVGAALACVRVSDTVKKRIGDRFQTIDRSDLWLATRPRRSGLPLSLRHTGEPKKRALRAQTTSPLWNA